MIDQVYSLLSNHAELTAMVKDIAYQYPNSFEDPYLPTISYYSPSDTPINAFEGVVGSKTYIHVDVWSKSADTNNQIAQKVVQVLQGIMVNENNVNLFESDTKIHHKVIQLKGI